MVLSAVLICRSIIEIKVVPGGSSGTVDINKYHERGTTQEKVCEDHGDNWHDGLQAVYPHTGYKDDFSTLVKLWIL